MSVKIDLNAGQSLQQLMLDMRKGKPSEIAKIKTELLSDLKSISEDSKNLKEIDPKSSTVGIDYQQQQICFSLMFQIAPPAQIKVSGVIKRKENILEILFEYEFENETIEQGEIVTNKYSFVMNLKVGYEEITGYREKVEKEDILKFIQRVAMQIFTSFSNKNKSLRGITLDQNSIEQLTKIDRGDINGLVQSLVGAVFTLVKMKEMNKGLSNKQGLMLRVEMEKNIMKDVTITQVLNLTVEINLADKPVNDSRLPFLPNR